MPNKRRLTFEVPEELHSRLKSEAASLGVSLGSHCSAILDGGGPGPSPSIELDAVMLRNLPLNLLRDKILQMVELQPTNWKRNITNINNEILRRHRI